MYNVKIKLKDESEIDTVLAPDINFSGVIYFEKALMVKGTINGEIKTTGELYVEENAVVNAKIEADKVSAKGIINGNIIANSKIELFGTARIKGDIATKEMEIESGCLFNGNCRMTTN